MAQAYALDASVFSNAFNPGESGHSDSSRCMERLRDEAPPILAPTLLLPELAAAIARGRNDAILADAFASAIRRLPYLILVAIDTPLAEDALHIAAARRLRGSDAVYAAVALRFQAILVTLDRDQLHRLAPLITVRSPSDILALPTV